jgi:hypothetical protein
MNERIAVETLTLEVSELFKKSLLIALPRSKVAVARKMKKLRIVIIARITWAQVCFTKYFRCLLTRLVLHMMADQRDFRDLKFYSLPAKKPSISFDTCSSTDSTPNRITPLIVHFMLGLVAKLAASILFAWE